MPHIDYILHTEGVICVESF